MPLSAPQAEEGTSADNDPSKEPLTKCAPTTVRYPGSEIADIYTFPDTTPAYGFH